MDWINIYDLWVKIGYLNAFNDLKVKSSERNWKKNLMWKNLPFIHRINNIDIRNILNNILFILFII